MKVIREIELRSDTMTKPTMEMRKAMFNAAVGDDGYGEDPTVKGQNNVCLFMTTMNQSMSTTTTTELQELGAHLLGKEECLYFPTGVMGNLASVMSHCWERGQEVILGDMSHIHLFEQGGISTVSLVILLRNNKI